MKFTPCLVLLFLTFTPVEARTDPAVCGTYADRTKEELYLSRQAAQKRGREDGARRHSGAGGALRQRAAARDIGNIAIVEDSDGVVSRRNIFNLSNKTVVFRPAATNAGRYTFETSEGGYEPALSSAGSPIAALGDDDSREIQLPFAFPFFGDAYRSVFVNSDGNFTFGTADPSTSERSLGRVTAGPPRVAALFEDLDPSASRIGVRVLSENWRFVATWSAVPEYSSFGGGRPQSFQIRLYPDGRVEMAWDTITVPDAVVGIAPGGLKGSSSVVSFSGGSPAEYSAAIAERFTGEEAIDIVVAAQKFFEGHDDAYDYLVVFNNLGVAPGDNALAFEVTVRNDRTGFGDRAVNIGREFGSSRRLQAFLNMGPLAQYPLNPNQPISGRGLISGDTPLTILGHEAGHLFLAFASVGEADNPRATPMLGRDGAHWAFSFNSEASLLEGNRIRDNGPGATPRFTTIATVEGYSPLDQYLMGFRPAHEVPPTFYISGAGSAFGSRTPQVGISMNGERKNVGVEDVIGAHGRRTPDHTVSQRRFNFAFVLVVPKGSEPTAAQIEQVETYRREFEPYFRRVSGERAEADTTLRRGLLLSTSPASGVLAGAISNATVSIASAAASPLTVLLTTRTGAASAPSSVTIPAGATQATFQIRGLREGVEELTAEASDPRYQVSAARIQVANAASSVSLSVLSGDKQVVSPGAPLPLPIVLRVSDSNMLPYPGARVTATVSTGGRLDTATAITDENGATQFRWTPSSSALNELRATIEGAAATSAITVTALGQPFFQANAVVNAASFASSITPGSLATIFGANLAGGSTASAGFPLPERLGGVSLSIGGIPAALTYVSDRQINFYVPPQTRQGTTDLVVSNRLGTSPAQQVSVRAVNPGIFYDVGSGAGAILIAGTGQTTFDRPAAAGDFLEIYMTGLGLAATPQVLVGNMPAQVQFSGLAPGFTGLYQVNARVPPGLAAGTQPVTVNVNGSLSNAVNIRVR